MFNLNPILRGGGNFVLHPKVIPITSIWVKLHKNVIRYVLEIINKSRDLPMTSLLNSPSIIWSNSDKIKSAVKNWYIRTKFYQWVNFKDCKTSKMKFQIFWKTSQFFPNSRFSVKRDIFEWFLDKKIPIGTWIWM